jgi:hypothetical protein
MTYSTPRSVRANCMATIKGLLKEKKRIKKKALRNYIMRLYGITDVTFERYIKDLIEIGLVKENSDVLEWSEQDIELE